MADEAAPPPPTFPAEDRIRETAKWLVVSLAAVGAVIITGTQFSSLGSVQLWTPRFWAVLIGAIFAAAGAWQILQAAVSIATTPPVTLQTLQKLPKAGMAQQTALQEGIEGGIEDLVEDYKDAVDARDSAIHAHLDNPGNQGARTDAEVANARAIHLTYIVRNVLRIGSYESVAEKWKEASRSIAWGSGISLLGLLIFIWAVNPSPAAKASEAGPAVVGEAAPRTLELSPDGQRALATELGDECDVEQPLEVAHLASTAAGPDVLVVQEGCKQVRLIVTDRWGDLKEPPPALPEPAPEPSAS